MLSSAAAAAWYGSGSRGPDWRNRFAHDIQGIDSRFAGDVGVYVKSLADGREFRHQADEPWYFASTIKVFVGACLLRESERGRLDLNEKIVLRRSDFVDGSGEVIRKRPGTKVSLRYLFQKMLTQSDSTATDILIRRIGPERLNAFVHDEAPGLGPITTILAVRNEAYAEAHPRARALSNLDFLALKRSPPATRLKAFARKAGVRESDLRVASLDEAFERYYNRGLNSGPLDVFGHFIERLLTGQILSSANTRLMLETMRAATTGAHRIQAGLPAGYKFAQKTGTQQSRMCNVGLITPPKEGRDTVVVSCVRRFKSPREGEAVFKQIGSALVASGIWR